MIVTDLMMPVMNGQELMKNISHDSAFNQVPTIIFSANHSDPHLGTEFIGKPFEIQDMIQKVENCCERKLRSM